MGLRPLRVGEIDLHGTESLHDRADAPQAVLGRKSPGTLADSRRDDAAALMVHMVAGHLHATRG